MLSLQEDIAREVAIQIAGQLLPAERVALEARPTQDPQAYDHFLRGNYFLAQRTSRAVARAIEEYETAARLDPGFTGALARAAYSYALYVEWGWPSPGVAADTLLARGLAAAERALARDSSVADAWMARSLLLEQLAQVAGAREAARRATTLDPENAEAWHQYGWALLLEGDEPAAVAAFDRALAIDPKRAITVFHLAAVRGSVAVGRTHASRRFTSMPAATPQPLAGWTAPWWSTQPLHTAMRSGRWSGSIWGTCRARSPTRRRQFGSAARIVFTARPPSWSSKRASATPWQPEPALRASQPP